VTEAKPKARRNKKAYSILPEELQRVSPVSLLLAESSSGPKITIPFGYMVAVGFPPETEKAYRQHSAKPFIDNNEE